MGIKVKIGMRVDGEVGSGTVIAMTNEWCIYKLYKPWSGGELECAEQWSSIRLAIDPPEPGQEISPLNEQEL
jgi:hypothetical protein